MTADDAAIEAHLREILASDDFKAPFSDRMWQSMIGFCKTAVRALTDLGRLPSFGVALVALTLLVALFVISWRSFGPTVAHPDGARRRTGPFARDKPADARALAEQARAFAADGQWRDAARALHQALLLRLCAQAGVAWRANVSDWEWLARLPPSEPLADFTRHAERLAFGGAPSGAQFDACLRLYEQLVGSFP